MYNITYMNNSAMRTVNFSDARSNLKAVLDGVIDDADVTIITRRDADDVVVMSLSTWNSWKETEYLLASPANARRLRKAIADMDAGRGVYRELLESPAIGSVQEPRSSYRLKPASKKKSNRTHKKKNG
jgi:antitoxin YefM